MIEMVAPQAPCFPVYLAVGSQEKVCFRESDMVARWTSEILSSVPTQAALNQLARWADLHDLGRAMNVDAKAAIEDWRLDYNSVRPHSSLAGRTPTQFAAITEGARRLMPARPNETEKPEDLTLPA